VHEESSTISNKPSRNSGPGLRDKIAALEQDFNSVASALLGTEEFAKTAAVIADLRLQLRKAIEDQMGRQLERFNMPSRDDIAALGERMMSIDERLIRVEEMLQGMAPKGDNANTSRPPRTKKKPVSKRADQSNNS